MVYPLEGWYQFDLWPWVTRGAYIVDRNGAIAKTIADVLSKGTYENRSNAVHWN